MQFKEIYKNKASKLFVANLQQCRIRVMKNHTIDKAKL